MGKAIINAIDRHPRTTLAGALEREDSPSLGRDAGELAGGEKTGVRISSETDKAFKKADVIIDFSTPEATMNLLADAVRDNKAFVIGTTGFSLHQRDEIKELSKGARIVMAPNMSIGVNLLLKLVHDAASVLGNEDAPSGTALKIAEVAAAAVNRDLEKVAVYERKGIIGERRPEEIGIQTIRAGDIG